MEGYTPAVGAAVVADRDPATPNLDDGLRVIRHDHGIVHLADLEQADGSVLTLCGNLIVRPHDGESSGARCPDSDRHSPRAANWSGPTS